MPDFFGVYDQLKAEEYLDFYGASYKIPAEEREALIPQLLELVKLTYNDPACTQDFLDYIEESGKTEAIICKEAMTGEDFGYMEKKSVRDRKSVV